MSSNQKNEREKKNQENEPQGMGSFFNHMMKQVSNCCPGMGQNTNCSDMMKNMMDRCCDPKNHDSENKSGLSQKAE